MPERIRAVAQVVERGQSSLHRYWKPAATPRQDSDSAADPNHDVLLSGPSCSGSGASQTHCEIDDSETDVVLSREQRAVLSLALTGRSVFFTGSAGTGKSLILRKLIRRLQELYLASAGAVVVTASTGAAACSIGGVTLHSFAGIGLGLGPLDALIRRVRANAKAVGRWLDLRVLIIDEVSMVDATLFDKLGRIAVSLRGSSEPFGGVQVVATGDFFQLPPVTMASGFAFEGKVWKRVFTNTVFLKNVFRQRDEDLASMLDNIRFGRVSDNTLRYFRGLTRPVVFAQGPEPTELFPRREDVENCNMKRLRRLDTHLFEFVSVDGGIMSDVHRRDVVLSHLHVPKRLSLKAGAQVMLVRNIDRYLVNGCVGTVTDFVLRERPDVVTSRRVSSDSVFPLVSFTLADGVQRDVVIQPYLFTVQLSSGRVQAHRLQIPLILAWAMSIHKAQGKTLDRLTVNLNRVFESGQVYVALSRAVCADGLRVLNFQTKKVRAHPKVIEWYRATGGTV